MIKASIGIRLGLPVVQDTPGPSRNQPVESHVHMELTRNLMLSVQFKAKFHYAIGFGAGSDLVRS